jgi:hypothetical protein
VPPYIAISTAIDMADRVGRFSFGLLTRIECLLILFGVMRSGTFRMIGVCLD